MDERGQDSNGHDGFERLFRRWLPRAPRSHPAPGRPAGLSTARLILIIELGGWTCTSLPHSLEQAGYVARVVKEEGTALEVLSCESPILLVVGGRPGPEFYRALRRASPAPILALVPERDEEQALAAFAAGVDQYQAGYVSDVEVMARIRALLRRGA